MYTVSLGARVVVSTGSASISITGKERVIVVDDADDADDVVWL